MNEIKVTTLTPIHIGSGNMLQYNTDYFVTTEANTQNKSVCIVDERKVMELLGKDHVNDWTSNIEKRGNTRDFVRCYAPQSKVIDYSKRCLDLFASEKEGDTLKECIHNGLGFPYIPGSSIKGAIRTAILTSLIDNVKDKELKIQVGRNIASTEIEKELFGRNPKMNVFRFLQVGDAYFERGSEIVLRLIMALNITQKETLISSENLRPQLVEAIDMEKESVIQLKISREYYDWIKRVSPQAVGEMPANMTTVHQLFYSINEHTRRLVESEIKYWEKIEKNKTGAEKYIQSMKNILSDINHCTSEEGTCVLRIGHASGWRFITGGWSENLSNFKKEIVGKARPNNYNYCNYDFPKSRRLDSNENLLGFIKLSVTDK
ncbi:type III-A CRISPR-associated RAMP protein Csm5 [Bacteroides sp.]